MLGGAGIVGLIVQSLLGATMKSAVYNQEQVIMVHVPQIYFPIPTFSIAEETPSVSLHHLFHDLQLMDRKTFVTD